MIHNSPEGKQTIALSVQDAVIDLTENLLGLLCFEVLYVSLLLTQYMIFCSGLSSCPHRNTMQTANQKAQSQELKPSLQWYKT